MPSCSTRNWARRLSKARVCWMRRRGSGRSAEAGLTPFASKWGVAPLNKPQCGVGEVADVGEYPGQLRRAAAEPARQRGGELIHAGGREQSSLPDLVVGLDRHMRCGAIELAAVHGAAHHEMMT